MPDREERTGETRPPEEGGFISRGMAVALVLVALFLAVNLFLYGSGRFETNSAGEKVPTSEILGIMLAAGLTLAMYSFLYRDNPLFKFAEHLYLGVSVGYAITIAVHQYLAKQLYDPLIEPLISPETAQQSPQWMVLIPVALGFCMLARFVPRYAWLSRYAFAIIVGWGAGLMIPQVVVTYLFRQVQAMMTAFDGPQTILGAFSSAIVLAGVISVVVYFFFSVKHVGPVRRISGLGIIFIMVSFGATFGFTVMTRISLLTGRAMFLLKDWLDILE